MARINVKLIAPFIAATHKTFGAMLGEKVTRKSLDLKKGYKMKGDISAMIGMTGDMTGTCSLSLPGSTAVRLIEKLICEKVEHGVDDVVVHDGVGELINVITGDAKTTLSETKYRFNITLPMIITGQGFDIYHRGGTRCVSVTFETEHGEEFALDVTVPIEK